MRYVRSLRLCFEFCVFSLLPVSILTADTESSNRILIIVLDGLRPDYVTPGLMPNLHALGERGVVYENHHAVFPTITRVNSPSISTGAYPSSHGLMGNKVYFPDISKKGLSTSKWRILRKIDRKTLGRLLTVPSIGEVYKKVGKKVLAVSSGSGGSALLLNHKGAGGGVIGTGVIYPKSMREHVHRVIGPAPKDARPDTLQNEWAVNAYLEIGLKEIRPDLTFMWLTDPDHTVHKFGIGAPETIGVLRSLDREIGRILEAPRNLKLEDSIDIFVTTDHGFSTVKGNLGLDQILESNGFGDDVILVDERAIYLREEDDTFMGLIVAALQWEPSVGAIFTRDSSGSNRILGGVPGTFSFSSVHWNHERAAHILVSSNWTEERNQYGYPGHTSWGTVANHGSDSPFDIGIHLFLSGPSFKRGVKIKVPSGNVDIAPTAYFLQGVDSPDSVYGRVLREALLNGPDPDTVMVTEQQHLAEAPGYRILLHESVVEGRRYFHSTKVSR